MRKSAIILVLALGVSAWSAVAQNDDQRPRARQRPGPDTAERDRPAGRAERGDFVPPGALPGLNLSKRQQEELADLRADTRKKFEDILTSEQRQKLKELRSSARPGSPGMQRFGQRGSGMQGRAMGRFGMGRPGLQAPGMQRFGMQGPGPRGPRMGPGRFGMGPRGMMQAPGMQRFGMQGQGPRGPGMGMGPGRFGMGPQRWGGPLPGNPRMEGLDNRGAGRMGQENLQRPPMGGMRGPGPGGFGMGPRAQGGALPNGPQMGRPGRPGFGGPGFQPRGGDSAGPDDDNREPPR